MTFATLFRPEGSWSHWRSILYTACLLYFLQDDKKCKLGLLQENFSGEVSWHEEF